MSEVLALIARRLSTHRRRVLHDPSQRRAAVLVPLFTQGDEVGLLFTRRTESVEHHKGQISFPGGAADEHDPNLLATALRETTEELGIQAGEVRILGALDDVFTFVSGFLITPYVGVIPYPPTFTINEAEIAEVITVPLEIFLDPSRLRVEEHERDGQRVQLYFYSYGPHVIWGATARIVKSFVDTIFQEPQV